MQYMVTYHGFKVSGPAAFCLVGIAFVFAPAFTARNSEEPVGGITFHDAERLAIQRRNQKLRREKAAREAAAVQPPARPVDGCCPPEPVVPKGRKPKRD